MRKLITGTLLVSLVLTGCSVLPNPMKGEKKPMPQPKHNETIIQKNTTNKKETRPNVYACEKETVIAAYHLPEKQIVSLNISAPTLGLKNQQVDLAQVASASGERYMNDKNKASIYEWHTKGKQGIFSVTADNKLYSYKCQLQPTHKR